MSTSISALRSRFAKLMNSYLFAPFSLLQWWHGNLSLRDFVADLLGTAAATAALLLIYWRHSKPGPPLAAAAAAGGTGGVKYQPVPAEDIELGFRSKEQF